MVHPLQAFFGRIPLFVDLTPDELDEVPRFSRRNYHKVRFISRSAWRCCLRHRKRLRSTSTARRVESTWRHSARTLSLEKLHFSTGKNEPQTWLRPDARCSHLNEKSISTRNLHPSIQSCPQNCRYQERLRDTNTLIKEALADDGSEKLVARTEEDVGPTRGLMGRLAFWRQR